VLSVLHRVKTLVSSGVRTLTSAASQYPYNLVVIGGGPGGYVAAIKAAQLGMKVACVESRGSLGGTCLNVGCIPSKALLNASHHYSEAEHHFNKMGIEFNGLKVNLANMMKQKQGAVDGLTKGVEGLFRANKVTYVKGFGKITGRNEVTVNPTGGGSPQVLGAERILIATGSEPSSIPNVTVDEKRIVTSTGALELTSIPKTMVVIGGGVIGLEMGSVWRRLGSQVTVVEFLDRLIPGTDLEIAQQFMRILERQKFKFKLSTKVLRADSSGREIVLTVSPSSSSGSEEKLTADVVLVATGRRPFTKGLGLESVGVQMNGLQITTNHQFATNIPTIFAIGDCITGPMLAHKAEEEGIACVELMAGKAGHVNYNAIPNVIYTHPEIATVGKSEDELKSKGIKYRVGKYPFLANSRARCNDDADGFVKVLADAQSDKILGVHIIGPGAGEMIAEGVIAIEYGASAEDIARTTHAHPTLSEAMKEACMDAYSRPINFYRA